MVPAGNENDISPGARQLRTEISACAACSENHNTHGRSSASRSHSVTARVFSLGLAGSTARQTHRKDRTLARLARHGDVATHHARELARDSKAEPCPAVSARRQGIGLGEILKQF